MKGLWNKLGDKFLSRIEQGTLKVVYSDGTQITYGNGEAPKTSLLIHDSRFFRRLALYGDIGFAESYMDGDFESTDLTNLISIALLNSKTLATKSEDRSNNRFINLLPQLNKVKHWMRKNSKTQSQKNISQHYDLSNDFFELMLDDTMMYSFAVFESPEQSLHEAQKSKIKLLADKLHLKEAVGKEYFDVFFKKCESLLKPSGVMVMQIITMPDQRYSAYSKGTDFIQKYIFPGGHLPSVSKILQTTTEHTRLNLLHMEEFTEDYAKTLRLWHDAFHAKLHKVKELGFDEYFIRMWKMYLCYCEAAFITRNINLVQVAFTRDQNTYLNKGLVA